MKFTKFYLEVNGQGYTTIWLNFYAAMRTRRQITLLIAKAVNFIIFDLENVYIIGSYIAPSSANASERSAF